MRRLLPLPRWMIVLIRHCLLPDIGRTKEGYNKLRKSLLVSPHRLSLGENLCEGRKFEMCC